MNKKPELSDELLNDIDKLRKTIVGALYANFTDELNEQKMNGLANISEEQMKKLLELLGKN